jgi:hypothetical protein
LKVSDYAENIPDVEAKVNKKIRAKRFLDKEGIETHNILGGRRR